ncbi:MAG TPA: hypothetical protein H9740_10940 [Candidatus Hungatella pullicola]|nr:hypothetical protein [Candidatus Hungatella pullicola]
MNNNWKQDPRLNSMDPNKIALLSEFAKKVETAPKNQLIQTLLALNLEAREKNVSFSDQETELLLSILSAGMSPAERKRMDTLKMISKSLISRSS